MSAGRLVRLACVLLALAAATARAELDALDDLADRLRWQSDDGRARAQLSGLFDLEGYYIDQHPPGLVYGTSDFVNPRLWLFLDTHLGDRLSGSVQARADRGFDPRSEGASFRLDEYSIRWTPLDGALVNLQIGKFPTLFGNWVARHDSWENPLIDAPLPYENVTIVSDRIVPASTDGFLARRNVHDKKRDWLPILWGPSYASGAAVFGEWREAEYGFEVKNASLSSRPSQWDFRRHGFAHPTLTARAAWHPDAAWRIGASASRGNYLADETREELPPNGRVGKYDHTLFGADLEYGWRHWQLWGEFFASRFEVPRVGDVDSVAYYLETKYKLTRELYVALRWNQQLFADVDDGSGREIPWDRDVWRVDTAVGYRFGRHLQAKLQYALGHQAGRLQQGEQLVAAQATLKF